MKLIACTLIKCYTWIHLDPYFLFFFFQEFFWTIVAIVMERGAGIEVINKEYLFKNKMWKIEKNRGWMVGRDAIKISPASESESVSHSVMSDSCDPMDCRLPDSFVHGILQSRILAWVDMPFSKRSSWSWDRIWVSHFRQILHHLNHKGSPPAKEYLLSSNYRNPFVWPGIVPVFQLLTRVWLFLLLLPSIFPASESSNEVVKV